MTSPTTVVPDAPASQRAGETGTPPGGALHRHWARIRGLATASAALGTVRRHWLAVVFGLSAAFAAVTVLVSAYPSERRWGELAAVSYAVSAVVAAARHRGTVVAVLLSFAGAMLVPLAWMASAGLAQPEVGVIIRSAAMFLHTGTPYASPAALAAAHTWTAYDPYLPALIAFGMPRALGAGLVTDPRIWFGAAFVITFAAALRVARVRRPVLWTALVMASPVVALPLSVGGDDLPVLGLLCLGLALADRTARDAPAGWRWPVAAGLALGLAAAMKATAWPALVVVLVLVARRGGWRATGWFSVTALGVAAVTDGPVVAASPAAAVANTVLYPLGLAKVASPAASVLPGYLLASAGPWGHWAALALLTAAGLGVGASLIVRPPKNAQAAGWRLVLGLTLMFAFAPASRVGYFLYPLGLAAWLLLSRGGGPGSARNSPRERDLLDEHGQPGFVEQVRGPQRQAVANVVETGSDLIQRHARQPRPGHPVGGELDRGGLHLGL
jgi:Glycosyltransferase family 87